MAARKKTTSSAKKTPAKAAAPRSTKKFLRNLTGYEVGIRLERQERPKKRHDLKPRGQRGDLVLLQKDDLSDPAVTENVALGVVEVITEAEARRVIEGQSTNQQQSVHPSLAIIKNELGEPITTVTLEADEADRGTVVANLEDGNLPSQGKGVDWARTKRGPGQAPGTPAGIAGADYAGASVPADTAEAADAAARQKSGDAHSLLPNVTVEPTKKG
jgi:hypothetical protein